MTPWHSLTGKTIWVAGGAGHLGSVITRALDNEGAKVICLDLAGRAAALVAEHGLKQTIAVDFNLAESEQLPALVADLIARHGVPDGHVHLTFASSAGKKLEQLTSAEFMSTFDQALPPTFIFCRTLAEAMKPLGCGSIVLFSSMYGVVAPDPGIYHAPMVANPIDYGAAKAALLQMSRYLAVHYGPAGIRFNCVTPGPFPNPSVQKKFPAFIGDLAKKTALHRVGANTEIVGPTLFLLTDSASFVTGHSLAVDGGWTAW